MTINQLLQKLDTSSPILQATFGLERENLRVTTDGHLAQTAHTSQLGSRNFHPTIQTDFSEQQLELITPIAHSTKEARRLLGAISDVAGRSIDTRGCVHRTLSNRPPPHKPDWLSDNSASQSASQNRTS